MIDSFVWVAPLILLPIVALVTFVGCDSLFGLAPVPDQLEAPTGLTATAGNNMVSLSWDPVDDAASYSVKRGTVSGDYDQTFADIMGTSYTDTSAVNGTTYYYVVVAVTGSNAAGALSQEVMATPSQAALISFVTSVTAMDLADASGWYGMAITVQANPITVIKLGRLFATGNSRSHAMKIVDAATGNDIQDAFTSVNLSGAAPGEFRYGTLLQPAVLQPGMSYYILCEETQGMDQFYNHTGTVMTTDVAILTSAARSNPNPPYVTDSSMNKPYGIVNFQY